MQYREFAGISLAELDRRTGIPRAEWCRLFREQKAWGLARVGRAAEKLGLSTGTLVEFIEGRQEELRKKISALRDSDVIV